MMSLSSSEAFRPLDPVDPFVSSDGLGLAPSPSTIGPLVSASSAALRANCGSRLLLFDFLKVSMLDSIAEKSGISVKGPYILSMSDQTLPLDRNQPRSLRQVDCSLQVVAETANDLAKSY